MISLTLFSSATRSLSSAIEQNESSVKLIGILNLECVVLPPESKSAAILLEATLITISPLDLTAVDKVFKTNVLPVPP